MRATTNHKKIVIIGAGYTGLTAAYRLAQAGNVVTVLDESAFVGGLASEFKIEESSLERAYHHIFKTDTDIIKLAAELGIGDKIKWHDSSTALYYGGHMYPFKGALDLIRFSPISLSDRIRAGLTTLWLQLDCSWGKYQKISAYDRMKKYAGSQVTDVIWGPLLKGKFDVYYDKVSMTWLWARIHIRAQSREAGGEKLGYFEGGFQTFTDALVKAAKDLGVTIHTSLPVYSINTISSGKVVVKTADGKATAYDACIATVPSRVFGKMVQASTAIAEKYVEQLNSIPYLGARLMIFSSSQNLSPYYWHNINDEKLPFLVFINHTNLVDKSNYKGKYIYYVATYIPHDHKLFSAPEKELKKVWFQGLQQVFPGFDKTKIHEIYTFAFANAQHIVDLDYTEKIPDKKTPLKNVYLSNFSQIYPEDRGTNYAVREGEHIAKLVNDSLPSTPRT